ncbi:MAG TPA: hypothetical protein PK413_21520 [Thermoanaerobaculia bacterium]|nr:hypothetical protein [Thermoanaerobaculia bacterium]
MLLTVFKALGILLLPFLVFYGVGAVLQKASHRSVVQAQLAQHPGPDAKPLNLRFKGYDLSAAKAYWGLLDREALGDERRFLELDLIFPFFYAGALAASLLLAWAWLGRPHPAVWVMLPPILGALADWCENLLQHRELQRFLAEPPLPLSATALRIAGFATQAKLVVLAFGFHLLLFLVVVAAVKAIKGGPG